MKGLNTTAISDRKNISPQHSAYHQGRPFLSRAHRPDCQQKGRWSSGPHPQAPHPCAPATGSCCWCCRPAKRRRAWFERVSFASIYFSIDGIEDSLVLTFFYRLIINKEFLFFNFFLFIYFFLIKKISCLLLTDKKNQYIYIFCPYERFLKIKSQAQKYNNFIHMVVRIRWETVS